MIKCFTYILFILISFCSKAQNRLISLSQKTNYYLNQTSDQQTFIASVDGLNIYDGAQTKVYRPSTHDMLGSNIQSEFYEDIGHNVWFCTYRALHQYIPEKDDFEYYLLTDLAGDTIRNDYRIIGLRGDSLYVHSESHLHIWDVGQKRLLRTWKSPSFSIRAGAFSDSYEDLILLGDDTFWHLNFTNNELKQAHIIERNAGASIQYDRYNDLFWIGDYYGYQKAYDSKKGAYIFEYKAHQNGIYSSSFLDNRTLALSGPGGVAMFDVDKREVVDFHQISRPGDCEYLENLHLYKVSNDGTTWVSSDGDGVFFFKQARQKFDHYAQLENNEYPSITGIYALEKENQIGLTTRLNGLIILDDKKQRINHILKNEKESNFTSLSGVLENDKSFLFYTNEAFYRYDTELGSIELLSNKIAEYQPVFIPSILPIKANHYLCSTHDSIHLYTLKVEGDSYSLSPILDYSLSDGPSTIMKSLTPNKKVVSLNEEYIKVINIDSNFTISEEATLSIKGGIRSLLLDSDTSFYLGNTTGLYFFNTKDYIPQKLKTPNHLLDQTIYGIYADSQGVLWLSTNSGIVTYDPNTKESHQYGVSEGVQNEEFNSHAYAQLKDGTILFGGVNGLNIFHPDSIKLSDEKAPVYFSSYLINDTLSRKYGVANFLENLTLPFNESTFSLNFHAIDYADPRQTRVKYKLSPIDENYVESNTAKGFVRYSNLDPGTYELSLMGANADGVWNEVERTISITVLPPWWQTWWARLLGLLLFTSIIYFIVRYRYKQQLIKKDFLLREQALKIEKQEALERERKRIAAEMHDDLGGGLTSISFLSRQLKAAAKDQTSPAVDRIQSLSSDLVNNMSEIIWAMDNRFDSSKDLIAYIRRNASEFLLEHGIQLQFKTEFPPEWRIKNTARRNIYLVIKEAIHNIIKHAQADHVQLNMFIKEEKLCVDINDNGIGLPEELRKEGNGIRNMRKRVESLKGSLSFTSSSTGLALHVEVPKEEILVDY